MADGRTALIVGASRGIGLGLAKDLRARGWRVTGTVRRPEDEAALREAGIEVERVDIADAASADTLIERVSAPLDLLVVNAGVSGPRHASVEEVTAEELGELMMTNAAGPVRLARRLLAAGKITDGGTVALMSSTMGSVSDNKSGGYDLYRMSKAALNMAVRSLDAELKGRARVLSLHPGWVQTDMGGPNAPLSVEDSARGLASVLERGEGVPPFVDYKGDALPW